MKQRVKQIVRWFILSLIMAAIGFLIFVTWPQSGVAILLVGIAVLSLWAFH